MQGPIPEQADKLRTLAAQMREHARHTGLPDYRDKFALTAQELERAAAQLRRHAKLAH